MLVAIIISNLELHFFLLLLLSDLVHAAESSDEAAPVLRGRDGVRGLRDRPGPSGPLLRLLPTRALQAEIRQHGRVRVQAGPGRVAAVSGKALRNAGPTLRSIEHCQKSE